MNGAKLIWILIATCSMGTSAVGQTITHTWTHSQADLVAISAPEADDQFAKVLAAGDFTGNGRDDLVIGVPFEDIGSTANAGAIFVRYFGVYRWQVWTQSNVNATSSAFDLFGASLAVSDLNRDGFDDLVVGIPFEDGDDPDEGAIVLFYGSSDGLVYHQTYANPSPTPAGRRFGAALAARDNHLVVGAPGLAGEVVWMVHEPPGRDGLCSLGSLDQNSPSVPGVSENGDEFGAALAIANYDPDSRTVDLIVGGPGEAIGSVDAAGAAWTLSLDLTNATCGSAQSPTLQAATLHRQGVPPFFDLPEAGDRFGATVLAADFDNSGVDEIVISVPFEDFALSDVGCIHIIDSLFDNASCLNPAYWGPTDDNAQQFGAALAADDFDNDGFDDLVIGMPGQFIAPNGQAGAIFIQLGSSLGLRHGPVGRQLRSPEIHGSFFRFGSSLATGNFTDRGPIGNPDIAIGEPGARIDGLTRVGRVAVLYTSDQFFADGFESGDAARWSAVRP